MNLIAGFVWKVYIMISSWRPAPTRKQLVHSAKIIRFELAVRVPVVLT